MRSRSLAERLGLERVLVTNGFYTVEIQAPDLDTYEMPPPTDREGPVASSAPGPS